MRSSRTLQVALTVCPASEQDNACDFVYNLDV